MDVAQINDYLDLLTKVEKRLELLIMAKALLQHIEPTKARENARKWITTIINREYQTLDELQLHELKLVYNACSEYVKKY